MLSDFDDRLDQDFWSSVKNLLKKLLYFQDKHQKERLDYAIEECQHFNLLAQMEYHQGANDAKAYKIIKFVTEMYSELVD